MLDVTRCPTLDNLRRFLLGQVDDEEAARIEQHLSTCQICLDSVANLEAEDPLMAAMRAQAHAPANPDDGVVEGLMDRLGRLHKHEPALKAVHILCPHCRNPIEIVRISLREELVCPSCGSSFRVEGESTQGWGLKLGQKLGKFELIDTVGQGAFGTVYKARDPQLDRTVAIKVPRTGHLSGKEELDRFLREARSAAQLRHPSIVTVHEVGQADGMPYLISDFIQGVTLADLLSARRTMPREGAELIAKVAEALQFAHEKGVIHRDVKPSNIMIGDDGAAYLMDFGLAKRDTGEITMTIDGQVLGTPAYMSPEQAKGEAHAVDGRSDVYSLGVILYELLTGEPPFRGTTRMLLHQVLHDEPKPPRRLSDRIPRDLETICLKAMAKEPRARYQTAGDLAADLRRFLNGQPIKARPVGTAERLWRWGRRNPGGAALVGISAILLLVIASSVAVRSSLVAQITQNALENDRKHAESLVNVALSAPAEAVPQGIEDLKPLKSLAVPILQGYFSQDQRDRTQRLHAALALTQLGHDEQEYLIDSIEWAASRECPNIVAALRLEQPSAVKRLNMRFAAAAVPTMRARLSIVLLHLGDVAAAQSVLALGPDPSSRTAFIHMLGHWHADPADCAEPLRATKDAAFQSGLSLAIGQIAHIRVESVKPVLSPILLELYENSSDSVTHSASGWTLRQWMVELPRVARSSTAPTGHPWFVNGQEITMIEVSPTQPPRPVVVDGAKESRPAKRSFFLSDREVSQSQFQRFLYDDDPAIDKPRGRQAGDKPMHSTGDHPVSNVSWHDAVLYCNWLSQKEGLTPCYVRTPIGEKWSSQKFDSWRFIPDVTGYRLPTVVEWEQACWSGAKTRFGHGDDESLLRAYAVFGQLEPQASGSRLPNAFGLFDMHGNLYEWCHDWDPNYSTDVLVRNGPMATVDGFRTPGEGRKLVRGGSHLDGTVGGAAHSRSLEPSFRSAELGFRVALMPPGANSSDSSTRRILSSQGGLGAVMQRARASGWAGLTARDREGKVVLTRVIASSPADKAGLKEGDVIVSLNEKEVGSYYALLSQLVSHSAGDKLRIQVHRGAETLDVELTLGAR